MIVDEVARPFSIASITAAFAAWLLPTSSTLTIRILSVAANPNRSPSGAIGVIGLAWTIRDAARVTSSDNFFVISIPLLAKAATPENRKDGLLSALRGFAPLR